MQLQQLKFQRRAKKSKKCKSANIKTTFRARRKASLNEQMASIREGSTLRAARAVARAFYRLQSYSA